jgi:sorting nexin-1/2
MASYTAFGEDPLEGEGGNPFSRAPPSQAPAFDAVARAPAAAPTGNAYTEDEDRISGDGKSFLITVTDPEKRDSGRLDSYTVYKVTTKTSLPQYRNTEFSVMRRYRDFLWLYSQLQEKYKGVILPPIPEKNALSRFNEDFIEFRRRELEKFLRRVGAHPGLQTSEDLQTFLEASEDTIASLQGKKPGDFFASFKDVGSKLQKLQFLNQQDSDQWFESKKQSLITQEAQLKGLMKATEKLVNRRRDMATTFAEFGIEANNVGNAEPNPQLGNAFRKLGTVGERLNELNTDQSNHEVVLFEQKIEDYCRIIENGKEVLNNRAAAWQDWQLAQKNLDGKQASLAKARGGKGNDKKVAQLEAEVSDAQRKVDEAKENFDSISRIARQEFDRFDEEKLLDFKRSLLMLLETEIQFEQKSLQLWENLLPEVKAVQDP